MKPPLAKEKDRLRQSGNGVPAVETHMIEIAEGRPLSPSKRNETPATGDLEGREGRPHTHNADLRRADTPSRQSGIGVP
jgi:hypothetical protein